MKVFKELKIGMVLGPPEVNDEVIIESGCQSYSID